MKKHIVFGITLAVVLIFCSTLVFAADADTERVLNPEEAFARFLDSWNAKFEERSATVNEKYNTMLQRVMERNAKTSEIVSIWYPEMLSEFESLQNEHSVLHHSIFDLKTLMKNTFHEESLTQLTQLHASLMVNYQEGTMTYKEIIEEMKKFREERVTQFKEMIDAYRETIEPAVASNEILKGQIKENLSALKSAIEASEEEAVRLAIRNIFNLLAEHNLFDEYKLTVLESF